MGKRDYVGIYKPGFKGKMGSVLQVKLASKRDCMFFELARQVRPQTDPKPYDWENTRITVKLGEADIGKLLAFFDDKLPLNPNPKEPDLKLFHKNSKGNKIIQIKKQANGYYLKVSAKEDGEQNAIAVPIGIDEAELVKIALKRGYEIMLGW